jgi:hypothetical protein
MMQLEGEAMSVSDVDAVLVQASALMKRGLRLLDDTRPEAVSDALACFNAARDLRRRLPIDEIPVLRYDLAACWLNRAEALVRFDDEATAAAALQAYDEAIRLLRDLPLEEDARYPRRLAIACQNRGLLLHARYGAAAAIPALTDAAAVLEQSGSGVPDRPRLLAAIWMNLANAWSTAGVDDAWPLVRHAATRAIALIQHLEAQEADAAEVSLKARHVLCRALAARLVPSRSAHIAADDLHAATDLADEALALVERWERDGLSQFRALAADFLRVGAHVYGMHQPQFLREFLDEHLDPTQSSPAYIESAEIQAATQEIAARLEPVSYYYVTLASQTH